MYKDSFYIEPYKQSTNPPMAHKGR